MSRVEDLFTQGDLREYDRLANAAPGQTSPTIRQHYTLQSTPHLLR